jgi:hypothetical protein
MEKAVGKVSYGGACGMQSNLIGGKKKAAKKAAKKPAKK